ncbi:hypothetical protein JB92DRAFT_16941 [Gautieria morchelliformis]|nr:hypothetical protein JB92DRAFT_16941 [Gautieria morchelliformis]
MELDTVRPSAHRLHELPVELVRRIFELAASSRVAACALCLVSRTVHEWILPQLYRTVVFTNYTEIDRWNSFYFNPIREVTRGSAAQIRSMMLKNTPSLVDNRLIVKDCSNIQHLVIVPDQSSHINRCSNTHISSLTHATLHGVLYMHHLHLPLFHTVTHLHIPDDIPYRGSDFSPSCLPNLTHVVWTLIPADDFCIWQIFPNWIQLLHRFATLRLVAIYVYSTSKLQFDMDLNSPARPHGVSTYDLPIFFIKAKKQWTVSDSENWIMGGESIWERTARALLDQGVDVME